MNQLYRAIDRNDVNYVKEFLTDDTEINVDLCLFRAISSARIRIVELLLKHGANPNMYDDGYTALHIAFQKKYIHNNSIYDTIIQLLINYGADLNLVTEDTIRETILICSVRHFNFNDVKMLLNRNVCVNIQNADGNSALHMAVQSLSSIIDDHKGEIRKNWESIINLLLSHGADCSLTNKKGLTPKDIARRFYDQSSIDTIFINNIGKLTKAAR